MFFLNIAIKPGTSEIRAIASMKKLKLSSTTGRCPKKYPPRRSEDTHAIPPKTL
jgi:hypothetical protein